MIQTLMMLIPQEAYLPAMFIGALLIILGARKIGMGIFLSIIFFAVFGPFVYALIDSLPAWLFAILCLLIVVSLFRMFFGNRVTDHVLGRLLYDLIRAPFHFMGWLLRGFGRRNL